MRTAAALLTAFLVSIAGCSNARTYEVRGQVLDVNYSSGELTIKHDDIQGFMPAMTMPFRVRDKRLLDGRERGELITATLLVAENHAYLSAIRRTGMAPVAQRPPAAPLDVVTAGDEVPDASFVDQKGRARRLADWRGQALAVTFVYTRCPVPNFCPLMDRHFHSLQREIEQDASLRNRVHLISVTFDPAHDTAAVLAAHAARVLADPAHWSFLTAPAGAHEQLDRFASRFGVSIIRNAGQTDAEIVHNLRTAVIDSRGRLVTILSGNDWAPSDLLTQLRKAG